MTKAPYRLADDVFACVSGNRFVFLDLRNDRYLCLNGDNTLALSRVLATSQHWNTIGADQAVDSLDTNGVVDVLVDRRMLRRENANERSSLRELVELPTHALASTASVRHTTGLRPRHWFTFANAAIRTSWKLHWYSMQRIVKSVSIRKQSKRIVSSDDQGTLHDLVAIFHHLRPFYIREYLCLYDSLALIEFLSQFRLFPSWVFAVKTEPFGAHCWVQDGDTILNDSLEYTSKFTPIMAV